MMSDTTSIDDELRKQIGDVIVGYAFALPANQDLKVAVTDIMQIIKQYGIQEKIRGAAYIYNIVFNSPKDSIYGEVGDGIEKLKRELTALKDKQETE
jgi:hypothetical protein